MDRINIIEELYLNLSKVINFLNEKIFNSELKDLIFLIQSEKATTKNTYGIFCPNIWRIDNSNYSEISLSAENLQSDKLDELLLTLVHEMLHYKNHLSGIKDTSNRGKFHNDYFKKSGSDIGLIFENKHPKVGWSESRPDDFLLAIFHEALKLINLDLFPNGIKRIKPLVKKVNKNYFKYKCLECPTIARAKLGINLICGSCQKSMFLDDEPLKNKQNSKLIEEYK